MATINNPQSLGLWENGRFSPESFFNLCQQASIDDHGTQIFTKAKVLEYRDRLRKDVPSTTATYVSILPVSWKQITLASSAAQLFEHYSGWRWYKNGCGLYEKAMSVAVFEQFYTQPVLCRQRQPD